MAFMMPVMKNNYDIYKDGRSRKSSECSNSSGSGVPTLSSAMGIPHNDRRRKVSECKSESFATSPSHSGSAAYRMQMQRCQSQRAFPRNSSRSSAASALSPTRSFCQASSPPKTAPTAATNNASGSQTDLSKFHLRLVEKLRKSFRREGAKRS